jgi:hypothetical protein
MNAASPDTRYQGKTVDDAIHMYVAQNYTVIARSDNSIDLARPGSFSKKIAIASVFAFGIGLPAYLAYVLLFGRERIITIAFDSSELVTGLKRRSAPIGRMRLVGGLALASVVSLAVLGFAGRTYFVGFLGTGVHVCTSANYSGLLTECRQDDRTLTLAQFADAKVHVKELQSMNVIEVSISKRDAHGNTVFLGVGRAHTTDYRSVLNLSEALPFAFARASVTAAPGTYDLAIQAGLHGHLLSSYGSYQVTIVQ